MVTEEERQWMWEQYAPEKRMRLNQGIRRRLAPLLENRKGLWLQMNALLLSLPGTPIVYYGDEIGMGDNIWLPDRNGCRTPMQWSTEVNGGFSTSETTYLPTNDDEIYGYKNVNVESQEADPDSYLWATRFLLKARKESGALRRGRMELIPMEDPAVLAYWRINEDERVLCLYNLSKEQQAVSLNLEAYRGKVMRDVLVAGEKVIVTEWPLVRILTPHASHWLRLEEQ
jgi:maltose alpha-D-glucosyltransferase/alpha-amylase